MRDLCSIFDREYLNLYVEKDAVNPSVSALSVRNYNSFDGRFSSKSDVIDAQINKSKKESK